MAAASLRNHVMVKQQSWRVGDDAVPLGSVFDEFNSRTLLSRAKKLATEEMGRMAEDEVWDGEEACWTPGVIMPDSAMLWYWDWFVLVLTIGFSCFFDPFHATFVSPYMRWWDWVVDACFWINIVITSQTSYLAGGYYTVVNPSKIMRHYILNGMCVDVVATVPWSSIVVALSRFLGSGSIPLWVLQLLRLVRALRVVRAPRLLWRRTENWAVHRVKIELVLFATYMIFIAHILACVLFLVPDIFNYKEDEESTVTELGLLCHSPVCGSWRVDARITTSPPGTQWLYALYWSVTTMTTMGYGDITAVRPAEVAVCVIAQLVGACSFAIFVTVVQKYYEAMQQDFVSGNFRNELTSYMHRMKVEPKLRSQIMQHISYKEHGHPYHSFDATQPIFAQLTPALRDELKRHTFTRIILRSVVFQKLPSEFTRAVATDINSMACSPFELFVRKGQFATEMFVVMTGTVCILEPERETVINCRDADTLVAIEAVIGEPTFSSLASHFRERVCVSLTNCSLGYISRTEIRNLIKAFVPGGEELLIKLVLQQQQQHDGSSSHTVDFNAVRVSGLEERQRTEQVVRAVYEQFNPVANVLCDSAIADVWVVFDDKHPNFDRARLDALVQEHELVVNSSLLGEDVNADDVVLDVAPAWPHELEGTLWIGQVPESLCRKDWLMARLSKYGEIIDIACRGKPMADGRHKSWALVTFRLKSAVFAAARNTSIRVTANDDPVEVGVQFPEGLTLKTKVHDEDNAGVTAKVLKLGSGHNPNTGKDATQLRVRRPSPHGPRHSHRMCADSERFRRSSRLSVPLLRSLRAHSNAGESSAPATPDSANGIVARIRRRSSWVPSRTSLSSLASSARGQSSDVVAQSPNSEP